MNHSQSAAPPEGNQGPRSREAPPAPGLHYPARNAPEDLPYARILQLRRHGPEPLYYQLAGSLEAAVASGSIKHGTKLPPEAALARELNLATSTVRHAWAYLEQKGKIARLKRAGTIVL